MIKSMEMVLLYRKRIFMKVNIKIIYEYMEVKKIEMEFILANFWRERDTEWVNLCGWMANNLRVIGKMVKRMAMASGNLQREIITKANGDKIGKMVKAITCIKVVPNITDILKIFWNREREKNSFLVEINIQESINMENHMAMANIYFQMEMYMKEILLRVPDKAKAC